MDDKELLELAAKAAGYYIGREVGGESLKRWVGNAFAVDWNPLYSNGDAFRLMVDRRLCVSYSDPEDGPDAVNVYNDMGCHVYGMLGSDAETTRRAITRAAAAMGENNV